jgi:hypothetical protein
VAGPQPPGLGAKPDNFGVVYATGALAGTLTGPATTPEALVLYDDVADHSTLATQLTALAAATGAGTKGIGTRDTNPSNSWLQADLASSASWPCRCR